MKGWADLGHGIRVSHIKTNKGYWGFGFDKTPTALTFQFGHRTIDIFWGYAK
jgi:hypothetical protein